MKPARIRTVRPILVAVGVVIVISALTSFMTIAALDSPPTTSLKVQNLNVSDTSMLGPGDVATMHTKMRIADIAATQSSQLWIDDLSSNHTGASGGPNESNGLTIEKNTGFDTTASSGVTKGIEMGIDCHVDTGSGDCKAVGLQVSAKDVAWHGIAGTMLHEGNVDFSTSPSVRFGNNVDDFSNPGGPSDVARIQMGGPLPTVNGFNYGAKNTAGSTAGYQTMLDTSVVSNARGGFIITRSSTGLSSNSNGLVMAGDGTFPFNDSAPDEVSMYAQAGGPLVFGADNVGFYSMFMLTPKSHLVVRDASGNNTPTLSANCTSGTGSSIVGTDMDFKFKTGTTSTACTVNFKRTYTLAPICTQSPEGTPTLATCTPAAGTYTCTTSASATTYNVHCAGQPGST